MTLFGQTLDYRKTLAARLGLTDVRDLRPLYNDLAVADPNAKLWQTDTDACCNVRKVLPLDRALAVRSTWEQVAQRRFDMPVHFEDFAQFERRMMNPTFADHRIDAPLRERVAAAFAPHCTMQGAHFVRPMHVRLLRRVG